MDGQIGGEINKPVRNNGVSDNSIPAKRAKLDEPIAKVCSEVTAKLNLSSSPMEMPDKARTVSSTDSPLQKPSHAFDFRFVAGDDEVRQLLVAQTCGEHQDVTVISHPDDLSQANLVSRLNISDDGRHTLRSGKLFEGSKPLTLVIDIRKLTSEDLPKFNDLLDPDNPCLYDKVSQKKRPLGEHVALLVVADPAQLAAVGQLDDAPGADFWRRINRPGNTWQFNAQTGNEPLMEIDEVPSLLAELPPAESAMDDDNTVVINCHLHSNWQQLLLGGPGVDEQGRIQHIPGSLELLKPGQRVILKGADWQDLAFEQTIRQMLAQKCFESNGKLCPLPDNVQFYQMPVGKDELHSLFQTLSHSWDKKEEQAPGNPIIINQSNIREWLSPIAIAPEGYAVPNTRLLEQVQEGGEVTVTSPLTEALWFRLLGSLQTIRETTDLEPRLRVAHTKRQPKALGLAENDKLSMRDHVAFKTATYQQNAQVSHWLKQQPENPLVIQINDQTSLSQLFDNIYITSEQKAHFGRRETELQEALTSGKPVVLRGLESNPTLQALLEPLAVGQPLLVNGQLQAYPEADVTLLWPESAKSPSSVFDSMVAKGKPCPEVDLWEINANKHEIPRTELPEQALDELYKAFKTVPANLCNPLPEMTEGLLNNLILAARRAQQVDQSPQLLPRHWRKAIDSVITHGTRQNPSVRDFMKVACWQLLPDAHKEPDAHEKPDEDRVPSVDPDHLNDIIKSTQRFDRAFVEQNLWPLARAFDPAALNKKLQLSYESPFPEWGKERALDRLCTMIIAHTPEKQRDALAHQLEVDPEATQSCPPLAIRPSRQIKRLQDALASGWQLPLPPGQTRSDAIHALANNCFQMARTAHSEAEGIERIEHRLSESLEWTGSADKPLAALARDLFHGQTNQKDRESRRLSRLHDRLADSPVIFLQGETGTGKSYFSARMAKASGQASVLSLGPSDSEQTLMKRWQWQEHADGDRSMAQQNRALMEWANTPSDNDGHYVTLVLDEANLAKTGLLASLNGLWEPQPCIYVNGHPVKVGPKHRVILTGNPDHYAGRQLDPALKEKLPRAYYPRLDRAFLRDRVVEPALVRQLQRHLPEPQINDIAHIASESVMALWQYYQELLPEHEFTPRDLTDICSWVGWYLDRGLSAGDGVTPGQINGLIRQSFRDVLGPEINETHQDALTALEIWFAARYRPENTLSDKVHNQTLSDIQQTFIAVTEQTRPDFDTSGSAVIELVQRLGQDLSRCQQAFHLNIKHDGRQATLIEGPAGRGKDATLNLVIKSVKHQAEQRGESMPEVFPLNACDCSWDTVCEKIQTAKVHGGIVVISEMNLIDSQHLEGELNDILAGDAHPGFHLFATTNPPEYSGRKPLSPALKGRFRHLPLRQYNPAELQSIAEKVLPETPQGKVVAEKLTRLHCQLRACLHQKKLPFQPTSLDLQNVAKAVLSKNDFTEDGLHQCLNQHYRLYLMAADLSLEELPKSPALAMGEGSLDSGLCEWLNQRVSGICRPWLIRQSDRNSIDEKGHEIRIKTQLSTEAAKTEIIRMVAQVKWQASGLSLKPDQSDDILTGALYRYWQQRWFDHEFGLKDVDADSVFPLTEEQKQTLRLPASQPYLHEADQRIEAWNSHKVQPSPALWHQMIDLPNHWAEAPEKYNPKVDKNRAETLDRETNYEGLETSLVYEYKIFDTQDPPPHMYRCQAEDIRVSAKGDITLINISSQYIHGAETLIPDPLPGHNQTVTLTSDQTLAIFNQSSKNGQFALPSLKPDDHIVALRIDPELAFTLVRDRYTGLHTVFIPEANAEQKIQFTYVVEPKQPGEKIRVQEARPERSTYLDTHCSKGMKTVIENLLAAIDDLDPPAEQIPLWKIKNARSTTQRIKAITAYCQDFSGKAEPDNDENFFQFLVTQRQGSCRHRVPVFIAFCRYYGIQCRQISNSNHSFAEYSVDKGKTWKSVDLGGEPLQLKEIVPDFQLTRKVHGSGTELKKFKNLLKRADSAQCEALAEALGIRLEALNEALETNSALPKINLDTVELVRSLWARRDLAGFSMGVSIIESQEAEALSHYEKELFGVPYHDLRGMPCYSRQTYKPMSEAVREILYANDEDQVTEPLRLLHSKMIDKAGACRHQWLSSIVDVLLERSDLTKPSFIQFAREALALGWLDPLSIYESQIVNHGEHYELLLRLEAINELKVNAVNCMKKWYKALLSREKNSQVWQHTYISSRVRESNALFVTHCHDGFSTTLENLIAKRSLQIAWTDQPEGVPNIERLLVRHPAFPQLNCGKANYRPVIILGQPRWYDEGMSEKTGALFRLKIENNPSLKLIWTQMNERAEINQQYAKANQALSKEFRVAPGARRSKDQEEKYQQKMADINSHYMSRLDSLLDVPFQKETPVDHLKYKCMEAIEQAFIHYLYEVTHSKGAGLTYCWAGARIRSEGRPNHFGAHDPSSPEELYAMMNVIQSSSHFQNTVKDAYLRQAHNASNALVLKSDELTKIAEEFLSTVNLNSLSDALDTW